jgi:histidinol-phosphate aminotransferase
VSLIPPGDEQGLGEGYHSPQIDVDVRLNTNEAPLPPPQAWIDELQAEVGRIRFNRYPDRAAAGLRAALAEFHGVQASQVFCANGSNEVLQTLLLTYGGPGRKAAMFEPTYALHGHIARITRTGVVEGDRNGDFTLDPVEVKRVLSEHRPEVTFLCSPNNPTGRAEPREVVAQVLELAPGLLVVDEAYGQFAAWSALSLVAEDRPLAVVRTFSKTWSMAAARLGYLVGPSGLVGELEKRVLPYHLDAVKQAAGRLALRYRPEMEARVAMLVEERSRLAAALAGLPVETWPSEANFILFRPVHVDADEVWQGLLDRSVLVRNCASWPRLGGCLRVTVGTSQENSAFLTALGQVLS